MKMDPVRDDDPAAVPCPFDGESPPDPKAPSRLVATRTGLLRVMQSFRAADDAFTYMRAFLADRGATSLAQLDRESRLALVVYLEGIRARLDADRP